jgi:eukaryotic-like serine/threonine-protein kinase
MVQWNPKANDIFVRAAEIDAADERRRFVERQCGGDAAVLAQVESLLAAGGRVGSFLDRPAAALGACGPTVERTPHSTVGTVVGRYKLLERIGEGGMGEVWVAEQIEPIKRKVALKIIKPGMDSRSVLARFEAERQALAIMDHPNIAKVLDAGLAENGRPFFVMEYVKGIPITEYCDRYLCTMFTQNQRTLNGHGGGYCVAFSPDGKRIASGNSFGSLTVRDAATGAETMTVPGYPGRVFSLAFSPDGKRIVTGGLDGAVSVWDAASGRSLLSISSSVDHYYPTCVAYKGDGQGIATAATGFGNNTLQMWDAMSGRPVAAPKTGVTDSDGFAYSRDGRRLLMGLGRLGHTLKVFDATSGEEMLALDNSHWPAAFSPDGKRIAGRGGADPDAIKVWDAATGKERWNLHVKARQVDSLAFSADGKRIVSGNNDGTLSVFDIDSGREVLSLRGHSGSVRGVAFSPDGKQIASGSWDKVKTWDATSAQGTLTINLQLPEPGGWEQTVAFSPDGRSLVTGNRKSLKVIDTATGREIRALDDGGCPAAFSPDGKTVAGRSTGPDTIFVWDARSGRKVLQLCEELREHLGVASLAYHPDGKRIASGGGDGSVIIWDAATRPRSDLLGAFSEALLGPASGRPLLTVKAGSVKATPRTSPLSWAPESVKVLFDTYEAVGQIVAFSPLGDRIATRALDPKTIKLWDATTGKELGTLKGHKNNVLSVAFHPDGKQIVSGSDDKTLKVWDATTCNELLTLKGHSASVECVAFSPDGKRIASGSYDRTLKIWDALTGAEVLTLNGHTGPVFSLAFSPDGKRIASGSQDGTVKLWDASRGPETAH